MTGCNGRAAEAHFERASYDSTPWDATEAMSGCSHSNTPASCFASICAAEKNTGDPDTQDHWALPHHKQPGGPPSKAGVTAALGRVDQTDGIDKAGARSHLERHAALWGGGGSGENAHAAAELRAAAGTARRGRPADDGAAARLQGFRAQFRHNLITVDGRDYQELDGYASVVEMPYEMWDMFGPYTETIASTAFDATLAANPDVAFLLNHRGVTMARTGGTPQTLWLDADPRGLHARALVNPKRTDVSDMLLAMDDGQITEMSFAFMIEDWEWSEDYEDLRILAVDLNRGDVSAVNFGANPYTSIEARAQEFLRDVEKIPPQYARAAFNRLGHRLGVPTGVTGRLAEQAATSAAAAGDPAARAHGGRSVNLVERLALLDGC